MNDNTTYTEGQEVNRKKSPIVFSLTVFLTLIVCSAILPVFSLMNDLRISNYGTVTYSTEPALIGELYVDGNYLKDSSGKIIILRGISLNSEQWYGSNIGYSEQQIIYIKSWGANAIRINVETHNIESGCFNDPVFWARLDNIVNWCEKHNMYILLNGFHAAGPCSHGYIRQHLGHYMGGTPHGSWDGTWEHYVNIFAEYAKRYAYKSHIIYESVEEGLYCPLATWQTQMRAMIDAIRNYDADAVCAIGAVSSGDWINQDFAFEQTHPINRPNLIFTFDEYGYHFQSNSKTTIRARLGSPVGNWHWGADWMLANGRCVMVAEFGGGGPWQKGGGAENSPWSDWMATWLTNFMEVLDEDGYCGYFAWRWVDHAWTCGELLGDWNGNPSPYGSVISAYYLAH